MARGMPCFSTYSRLARMIWTLSGSGPSIGRSIRFREGGSVHGSCASSSSAMLIRTPIRSPLRWASAMRSSAASVFAFRQRRQLQRKRILPARRSSRRSENWKSLAIWKSSARRAGLANTISRLWSRACLQKLMKRAEFLPYRRK